MNNTKKINEKNQKTNKNIEIILSFYNTINAEYKNRSKDPESREEKEINLFEGLYLECKKNGTSDEVFYQKVYEQFGLKKADITIKRSSFADYHIPPDNLAKVIGLSEENFQQMLNRENVQMDNKTLSIIAELSHTISLLQKAMPKKAIYDWVQQRNTKMFKENKSPMELMLEGKINTVKGAALYLNGYI